MRNRRNDGAIEEVSVLVGEKILITGPAGRIAFGLARSLAADNEVWGIARFGDPATRDKVEALGVTTRALDIADGRFGDLPTDFTYLLHLAADFSADDYDRALRVNAEATGFLLEHCRNGEGSAGDVDGHRLQATPRPLARLSRERPTRRRHGAAVGAVLDLEDRPGGGRPLLRSSFELPVTIARMGAAYGDQGGLPSGTCTPSPPVSPSGPAGIRCPTARSTTTTSAPRLEPLLGAASVPATIVNWCGDEPVSVQQWAAYFGELLGVEAEVLVEEIPGASRGSVGDPTKRALDHRAVPRRLARGLPALAEHFYPDRVRSDERTD